jgi:lysophospholipase L1-like esterase
LFIGDSHTANHGYGWQVQLCQATGLIQNNISVGGKTTGWMLTQANLNVNPNYDYCFIYGGANDMYNSHISAANAFNNIQVHCKHL